MRSFIHALFVAACLLPFAGTAADSSSRDKITHKCPGPDCPGDKPTATPPTKARAEVKGEAAAANKSGDVAKVEKKPKLTAEEKAAQRAKRKAEAASAVKAGATVRGEGRN